MVRDLLYVTDMRAALGFLLFSGVAAAVIALSSACGGSTSTPAGDATAGPCATTADCPSSYTCMFPVPSSACSEQGLCIKLTKACGQRGFDGCDCNNTSASFCTTDNKTADGYAPSPFLYPFPSRVGAAGTCEGDPHNVVTPPPSPVDSGLDAFAPPNPYIGSPLCKATTASCSPDSYVAMVAGDPGPMTTCNGGDAGAPDPDGGAEAGPTSCRVNAGGGNLEPTCVPAGYGHDGDTCATGADCAPGFDCTGSGTCRSYCCQGQCLEKTQFCDVQPMYTSTALVPVCMPVVACKLLEATGCPASQTCSIVRDDGTTSCVATGPAGVGDSCDTAHCAVGLVCLGQPSVRFCFQLCDLTNPQCPANTQCKQDALSKEPTVGICE
jgi:hypothetical protein